MSSHSGVRKATDAGATAMTKVRDQADGLVDKVRPQIDAMVEKVRPQMDAIAAYAREEPTKALLISAAAGAGLMGLLGLMARPASRKEQATSAATSAMSALRDAAVDLADRAHDAAGDALGSARKRASSAADTVAETWQSLREQAAPMVDKLRPQLDAVATYAKDEPARTALGVATVGAILLGLFSLARSSETD